MRNPKKTRHTLLATAGELFNKQGYDATSLSDITSKSGLTKGAIYRHFGDKSGLEIATSRYLCSQMMVEVGRRIKNAQTAPDKLRAIICYFEEYDHNPPFPGGCPLMNAAIEADDKKPELKSLIQEVMHQMHSSISRVVQNGIRYCQLEPVTDPDSVSSLIISSLEGAVMMSRLMDDTQHLSSTIGFLEKTIEDISI